MKRLVKSERALRDPSNFKQKIAAFLTPTLSAATDAPPTVNGWYRATFNGVDKFDGLLGHLKTAWRVKSAADIWLLGCLRFAAVNTYSLWGDIHFMEQQDDEDEPFRAFILALAEELAPEAPEQEIV